MLNRKQSLLCLFGLIIASTGLNSQATEVRGLFGAPIDFGGKTLVSVDMSDGSTKTIKSHEGFGLQGGVYAPLQNGLGVSATIGYKIASITASNGTIELSRVPIEVIGSKQLGPHRFGGGITHQTNISYSCDISGICNDSTSLDDATGLILSYEFMVSKELSPGGKGALFGVRYTSLELTGADKSTVDASGIGMYIGGQF